MWKSSLARPRLARLTIAKLKTRAKIYSMREFVIQEYHLEIIAGFLVNVAAGWFLAMLATKSVDGLITDLAYCILSLLAAFQLQKIVREYD